jgi:hypothetical protein
MTIQRMEYSKYWVLIYIFFYILHILPGAHPASYRMGTGSIAGAKAAGA